jgi:hypothetical protein
VLTSCAVWLTASTVLAQASDIAGVVRDETGGALPGVSIELRGAKGTLPLTVSDDRGRYRFDGIAPGTYQLAFSLINFATTRRVLDVPVAGSQRVDAVMHLALNADVTVTGKRTFANLADVANPEENLVGIAQSASQGAVTARQLDTRPMMRTGEVLETVPGLIISQHSGDGKANQYYLRGFNLDHGTDFATTLAGMPVNMPTHGHGHGYSDLNFLIPELVSGVQFSKGPYFAEQGDFATAGSSTINYTSALDRPIVRVAAGDEGFARALAAASPAVGSGHLLGAFEVGHNDGPWDHRDDYRRFNGLVRYSQGDALTGWSLTGMGYKGAWNSTDQIPQRAVSEGLIGRFGAIDPSDGGDTYRYSGSFEWQRTSGSATNKVVGYGIGYNLNLYSDFTFFLDDPVRGDQFHQADRRFVSGAKYTHRRLSRWSDREVQNTVGVQLRHDDIRNVALYHTQSREYISTTRQDSVLQTSVGVFLQNETAWSPWVRTLAGVRVDGYRFAVDSIDPLNSGEGSNGIVSPKGGLVLGPWRGTEFYGNAGLGFHSNDARGATITRDPATGGPAERVTPLVRAKGAEAGFRTVAVPRVQTSLVYWTLHLDSELVFVGDAGTTEAARPSHRHGIELTNYYSPRPWARFDLDLAWSQAHFTDQDPAGPFIPGSVVTVVSAGATLDEYRKVFGSLRWRYFGPRPLIEDNSVRSHATSLVNLEAGYRLAGNVRVALDVFNLFNAANSDIDYWYASRLPGEAADGVEDIHFHPTVPRTARVNLVVGF